MLSVIVPTLNEEDVISEFLEVLEKSLKGIKYEVIIVDDSETNETIKQAEKTAKKLKIKLTAIKRKNQKGKGSAVFSGIKKAKGSEIAVIDADLEYSPEEIKPMLEKLKNADIVISERKRKDVFYRQMLMYLFRFFTGSLFGLWMDTQSGLKILTRETAGKINIKSTGWSYDVDMLYQIKKKGLKIAKHKIIFTRRKKGKSKIHPVKTSIEMFKDLIKIRFGKC